MLLGPHRLGPQGDLCARRIGEEGAPKNSPSLLPCRAQMGKARSRVLRNQRPAAAL